MLRMVYGLSVFLLAGAASADGADIYKWQDAQGAVHYTGKPPPTDAREVQKIKGRGNLIESDLIPYEARQIAQKYPVTLYSFAECGAPCKDGEALLIRRGIPYTLKNQETDKEAVTRLTGDDRIPVLIMGGQPPLKGFQADAWNHLLNLAGYPNVNPLGNLKKQPVSTEVKPTATDPQHTLVTP